MVSLKHTYTVLCMHELCTTKPCTYINVLKSFWCGGKHVAVEPDVLWLWQQQCFGTTLTSMSETTH